MHITFLTGEYPPQPGGIGDYTQRLAQALATRGHTTSVLTIREHSLLRYQTDRPDLPAAMLANQITWAPRSWPVLRQAIAAEAPDWLHVQYQTGAFAMRPWINLLPWYLQRQPIRPRIAVTFHDLLEPYLFPKAGRLRRWITYRLARDADAVIVTNNADAATLAAATITATSIPIGSNIAVAPPNGYERTAWRAQLGVATDELLVAYFGLLSHSKGADLLLDALVQSPELPWRLLVIGGAATSTQDRSYATDFTTMIARNNLERRVIITGHVTPAEVSAHLLAADYVALPFRDGASFRRGSLLAALEHGCPLLTTTPGDSATSAALPNGTAALLVPPGDRAALATGLKQLAYDPALRIQLGRNGRAVAARFSWDAIAAHHEACYSGPFSTH